MDDRRYLKFGVAIKAAFHINDEDKRNIVVDHLIRTLQESVETRTERGVRLLREIVSMLLAITFSLLIMWLLYDSYEAGHFEFFKMLISSSLAGIVIGGVATYFIKK